jgi:hypothetical protein
MLLILYNARFVEYFDGRNIERVLQRISNGDQPW